MTITILTLGGGTRRHCSMGTASSSYNYTSFVAILVAVMAVGVYTIPNNKDANHFYINWHKNPGTGGPFERLFYPTNNGYNNINNNNTPLDDDNYKTNKKGDKPSRSNFATQDQEFRSGLNALKDIVETSLRDGKRLRPCKCVRDSSVLSKIAL
jgi:hypothetical protein